MPKTPSVALCGYFRGSETFLFTAACHLRVISPGHDVLSQARSTDVEAVVGHDQDDLSGLVLWAAKDDISKLRLI
jgi:hypothetical protein